MALFLSPKDVHVGDIYKLDKLNIKRGTYEHRNKMATAVKLNRNAIFIKINEILTEPPWDEIPEILTVSVIWLNQYKTPLSDEELVTEFPDGTTMKLGKAFTVLFDLIPLKIENLSQAIENKAKIQAIKDSFSKKGVLTSSDSGPLKTILDMSGIKAPPKQSGLGRRKSYKKKIKKTKKTLKH